MGISDLTVDTVFRTVDGFVTPWANWESGEPSRTVGPGVEDQVSRLTNGKWNDGPITATWRFYCEGNRSLGRASTVFQIK